MTDKLWAGVRRFAKGFVAGGLASVLTITAAGVSVTNFEDLKGLGLVLLSAFLTGGMLSVQKMLSWVE